MGEVQSRPPWEDLKTSPASTLNSDIALLECFPVFLNIFLPWVFKCLSHLPRGVLASSELRRARLHGALGPVGCGALLSIIPVPPQEYPYISESLCDTRSSVPASGLSQLVGRLVISGVKCRKVLEVSLEDREKSVSTSVLLSGTTETVAGASEV